MGKFFKTAKKIPDMAQKIIAGAAAGAVAGAISGEESKSTSAAKGAIAGGIFGAAAGHLRKADKARSRATSGGGAGSSRSYNPNRDGKFRGDLTSDLKNLGVDKKTVKTKKEVKLKYRKKAMKHHPDKGGDPERMSSLNSSWEKVKNSGWYEKLAFWMRGFGKSNG